MVWMIRSFKKLIGLYYMLYASSSVLYFVQSFYLATVWIILFDSNATIF